MMLKLESPINASLLFRLLLNWFRLTKMQFYQYGLVEVSSRCTLKCIECYRTGRTYTAKNLDMPLSLFKTVIDNLPRLTELVIQGIGEPTLNPYLPDMIQYAVASRKFKRITFNTNLMVPGMNVIEYFSGIFNMGLSYLYVSVDTFNQSLATEIRTGTDCEMLRRRLAGLAQKYHNKLGVRITVSEKNKPELPDLLNQLVVIGIKRVVLQAIIDNHQRGIRFDPLPKAKILELKKTFKNHLVIDYESERPCTAPFTSIIINVRGIVVPCCKKIDEQFGVAPSSQWLESSRKGAIAQLRKTFYSHCPSFCINCPDYPQYWKPSKKKG